MSWTRRFLVLIAFALMLAGVALMVTQKEELYLGLSVAGFALVLAAVPGLPKEPAGDEVLAEPSHPDSLPEAPPAGPPPGAATAPVEAPAGRQTRAQGAAHQPAPSAEQEKVEDAERQPRDEPARVEAAEPVRATGEQPGHAVAEPIAAAATVPASPPLRPEGELLERPAVADLGRVGAARPVRTLVIGCIAAGAVVLLWRWLRR